MFTGLVNDLPYMHNFLYFLDEIYNICVAMRLLTYNKTCRLFID